MEKLKTVLIVDDSRLMRCLMKELSSEHGLRTVAEAANGEEAIRAYRDHHPDLVILDIVMSDASSGIDVLQDIRLQNRNARVLIVTESKQEAVHRLALDSGAAAILSKPINTADFKAALDRMDPFESTSQTAPAVKRRVMVVDDSPVMRAMVKEILTSEGLEVVGEAGDVPEAIAAYDKIRPDLVTLDLVMPGGTGADVLKSIRSKNPSAQVIMVTSVTQTKVTEELFALGAGAVLSKPLTTEKFKVALAAAASGTSAAPAAPAEVPRSPNDALTGVDALLAILQDGGSRGVTALNALFESPWALSGTTLHNDSVGPNSIERFLADTSSRIAVRLTATGAMPAVCIFLVDRDFSEKIARLLAPVELSSGGEESARLVAMEWANVVIMNVLNAFADTRGSMILSSTPEFDEAPISVLIAEALRKLAITPSQAVLARSRFISADLGGTFETVLILASSSVSPLTWRNP